MDKSSNYLGLFISFLFITTSNISLVNATAMGSNFTSLVAGISTTTTPIKHLVVIFQENNSFDHYFATYPIATNPQGEPKFIADPHTPSVNNLMSAGLLTKNSNSINPFRFDRTQAITCDMTHDYRPEQQSYNGGLLNKFVEFASSTSPKICIDVEHKKQVMGYYDGNTVTALWIMLNILL
jgi:phospholipase C